MTLRAEEVKTLKACITVDHIEENGWGPPLFDAEWHAFCQASYKGIEGSGTAMACGLGGLKPFLKHVGKTHLVRCLALLGPVGQRVLRTASTHWNVPGKYGPHGQLFFFLVKMEQVVTPNEVLPNPLVFAETLKACARIGLHLLAAEDEAGDGSAVLGTKRAHSTRVGWCAPSRVRSPELGGVWKYGCPKSPDWGSDVESWTESERTCSSEQCE